MNELHYLESRLRLRAGATLKHPCQRNLQFCGKHTPLVGLQTSGSFPFATSSACTTTRTQRTLEQIGKIHCSDCEQKQAIYEHPLAVARVAQKIELREPCLRRLGAPGGQQAGEVRGEPLFCWLSTNGRTRLTSTKSAGLLATRMHLQRKGTAILPTASG